MFDQLGPWTGTVVSVLIVSALPFGATFLMARRERAVQRHLPKLTEFAAGAVLGAALLHIIPESVEQKSSWPVAGAVLFGYVAFWIIERLLAGHDHAHAHGIALGAPTAHDGSSDAECVHLHPHDHGRRHALVPLTFAGDALHNIVDGMLIAAGFLAEPKIGLLTLMAVALHELPREVGTFSLFVHGGIRPMRAVFYNGLTAMLAMLGAAVTLVLGTRVIEMGSWLLPVAAGTYVYIAWTVGRTNLRDQSGGPVIWTRLGWGATGFGLMLLGKLLG